jgi:hypothetical protein
MSAQDETTSVVIFTNAYRIAGRIELIPGARLTDFIRAAPDFIAVTAAKVSDRDGKALFSTPFLDVDLKSIELIVPADIVTWH